MDTSLSLEFSIERLKRYLEEHPEESTRLALTYFEDFSVLAAEHKKLERDFQILQLQNFQLQAKLVKNQQQHQNTRKSPQLPHFLNPSQKL